MSADNSSAALQGNPVLYTFIGFTVQPYWLIIIELGLIQFLQRLYSRFAPCRTKEEKTWFIPLELVVIGADEVNTIPPKYSLLDFILSLVSVGHFVFASYRQVQCSSNVNYTAWRCYNAFGYRLCNYVMPSVIAVLVQSIVQVKNTYRAMKASKYRHDNQETCCFKMAKCSTEFLLGSTIIMNVAICLVFLPYMVTNSIPMIVGFCWLLLPLLAILTLVYALIITAFVSIISRCAMCDEGFCCRFFFTHCAVGLQVFGCLIISMAYNYSQYCYFGSGYLPAVVNEFQSRDTAVWAHSLVNDTTFQIHNILAFF